MLNTPILLTSGDQISSGTHKCHSKFAHVVNFIGEKDGLLIAIVAESIGAGPANLVLRNLDFANVSDAPLCITEHEISIDNIVFARTKIPLYNSDLALLTELDAAHVATFKRNINTLQQYILQFAHPLSLAFLLEEVNKDKNSANTCDRLKNFSTPFAEAFAERARAGAQALCDGRLADGAKSMKGIGFGLTPSGDDFNAGFILAQHVAALLTTESESNESYPFGIGKTPGAQMQQIYTNKNMNKINELYKIAWGKNIFANTFLHHAKNGWVTEKIRALISAMCNSDQTILAKAIPRALESGASSGADFLTGLVLGLKTTMFY